MMARGHWEVTAEMFDCSAVNEGDREHIAEMVQQGYTEGELIHDDDGEED